MHRIVCGLSNRRRTVCFPGCAARQPDPVFVISADSIGCAASSDEISAWARSSRSSQFLSAVGTPSAPGLIIRLRMRLIPHLLSIARNARVILPLPVRVPLMEKAFPIPRLIIVCGLPGSGKTIHAKLLEGKLLALRFSADDWMDALSLDLYDEGTREKIEALQ